MNALKYDAIVFVCILLSKDRHMVASIFSHEYRIFYECSCDCCRLFNEPLADGFVDLTREFHIFRFRIEILNRIFTVHLKRRAFSRAWISY